MGINSFDEWTQLREIVVGSAKNYTSHDRELSFDLFFHDNLAADNNLGRSEWYYPRLSSKNAERKPESSAIKERYVDELNEDLEDLASTLTSLDVRVLRPLELSSETSEITTPAWSAAVVPPLNVRDIALVVGNEVIETPPMIRSRYFENQFLTNIYGEYFERGAKWTVMPRPLMTDHSFDTSYVDDPAHSAGGPMEPVAQKEDSPYDVGFEMMFDGAQVLRLGTDLLVNVANANHEMACTWLERHLEGRFNIHKVHALSDSHIDSMVLALRPGLLLVRNEAVHAQLPEFLQKWDYIVPPAPTDNNFPEYGADDLVLTSKFIDMNVLSVNEETVLVNEACPELIVTLESRGFTVVPVRHRHRRLFGGGFHCFTLDTVRDGGPVSYAN